MVLSAELTPEFLKGVDWGAPIKDTPIKVCELIWNDFINASKLAEAGDVTEKQTFDLLGRICSLSLRAENKNLPFAPLFIFGDRRSPDITDFSEDDVSVLKLLFPYIKQNDIRARIADVIWCIQHKDNFQYAEQAVDAYLLSFEEQIFGESYTYGLKRISRALHLAASLGRQSGRYKVVIQKIDSLIVPFVPRHNSPAYELIQLLLEYREGDLQKLAGYAESCALDAEADKNWYIAGHYWGIKAKCHRLAKEIDREQQALQMLANTYVSDANDSLTQRGSFAVAAHHLQSAIEILRRIPDTKEQQKQLHKTMLEYQQKSLDEMGQIHSGSIDLSADIENFISKIKDKTFLEGIIILAMNNPPISQKRIMKFVEELAQESPLYSLMPTNIIDSRGKVVGQRSSILNGSEKEVSEAKEAEMYHWANIEQDALAAIIDNTRRYFLTEHNPSPRDFYEIVSHNPFVPPGREDFYAQGFLSGLQGDFLAASHILVPQIENSIRYVLNRNNIITSSLNSDGIQADFDLNKLLDMPETANIFHEDIIFGLKGTLTSRFGGNFRNLLSHGLLEYGHFYSYIAVYIWWLLLKICCIPMINNQENNTASS
jgi:Domain of unknown function (DUF4209)